MSEHRRGAGIRELLRQRESTIAAGGVCLSIAGFAAPLWWGIPLLILSLSAAAVLLAGPKRQPRAHPPLMAPTLLFLLAAAVAILTSEDPARSLIFSAPLVPGFLVFFLVAEHFRNPGQIHHVCLALSSVSLAIAGAVLFMAWRAPWMSTYGWAAHLGSPIFIVPNDATLMSLACPISLALLFSTRRPSVRFLSTLSIVLSIWAMFMLRSRVAVLTAVVSVCAAAVLMRPRLALLCTLAVLLIGSGIDAAMGFPLAAKFGQLGTGDEGVSGRLLLWSAAWSSFLERPGIGHGPGTFSYAGINWTHNLYLQTLAEQGVVGLLALLFLLCGGLAVSWATRRDGFGAAVFSSLLGFCLASLLELTLSREWVAVYLFTYMGIASQLYRNNQPGWKRTPTKTASLLHGRTVFGNEEATH